MTELGCLQDTNCRFAFDTSLRNEEWDKLNKNTNRGSGESKQKR
jgi:hypothetical protein